MKLGILPCAPGNRAAFLSASSRHTSERICSLDFMNHHTPESTPPSNKNRLSGYLDFAKPDC
jgi:hypothetical protein